MLKEDKFNGFKKTTGELNEAMISLSAILKNRVAHSRDFSRELAARFFNS